MSKWDEPCRAPASDIPPPTRVNKRQQTSTFVNIAVNMPSTRPKPRHGGKSLRNPAIPNIAGAATPQRGVAPGKAREKFPQDLIKSHHSRSGRQPRGRRRAAARAAAVDHRGSQFQTACAAWAATRAAARRPRSDPGPCAVLEQKRNIVKRKFPAAGTGKIARKERRADDNVGRMPQHKRVFDSLGPVSVANLELDFAMREAAFQRVRLLTQMFGTIPAAKLAEGFEFRGARVPLIDPGRGIHKPRAMPFLLSIRTVFPRPGRKVWYDDQREIHQRIFQADETFRYDFMGKDPAAAHNRWLREAMLGSIPVVYFLGIAPARYEAIVPTFIVGWEAENLRAQIAFGAEQRLKEVDASVSSTRSGVSDSGAIYEGALPSSQERRYALRTTKQRLHQASFREAVFEAYRGRCAFSGLPEPLLLDAAHIVADRDEQWGQPLVTNGLPLSKVHHAAFDAHLIGVDPDYRIHVSDRLLARHDGEILRVLKALDGNEIRLPRRVQDAPSRERLDIRFAQFKAVG